MLFLKVPQAISNTFWSSINNLVDKQTDFHVGLLHFPQDLVFSNNSSISIWQQCQQWLATVQLWGWVGLVFGFVWDAHFWWGLWVPCFSWLSFVYASFPWPQAQSHFGSGLFRSLCFPFLLSLRGLAKAPFPSLLDATSPSLPSHPAHQEEFSLGWHLNFVSIFLFCFFARKIIFPGDFQTLLICPLLTFQKCTPEVSCWNKCSLNPRAPTDP